MDGHRIGGVSLCPASVLLELAAAGIILVLKQVSRHSIDSALKFNEFTFAKPLMADSDLSENTMHLRISVDTQSGSFSICSDRSAPVTYDQAICSEGRYKLLGEQEVNCKFDDLMSSISGPIMGVLNVPPDGRGPEKFSTRAIYDLLFARAVLGKVPDHSGTNLVFNRTLPTYESMLDFNLGLSRLIFCWPILCFTSQVSLPTLEEVSCMLMFAVRLLPLLSCLVTSTRNTDTASIARHPSFRME